jgi:hypothetical protein
MERERIDAIATAEGLAINGRLLNGKLALQYYQDVLGPPSRTIDAGPSPAPFGHRNNQVHTYDLDGVYLTEHHASRLIESVNFVFDSAESLFPIERAFSGGLKADGQEFHQNMTEQEINSTLFGCDLPGEYSIKLTNCWIGISAKGRRGRDGRRKKPRYVVRVSVCF